MRRRALALAALAVAACAREAAPPPATRTTTLAALTDTIAATRRTAITQAVGRVGPSVVSITVTSRQRVQRDPFFDFFGMGQDESRLVQGSGTGFVWRADGTIITNQHVVSGAEKIVVTFGDGTDAPAELVGEDPRTDIAVIRVARRGLVPAPLGSSRSLLIGEWVIAVGNPFAFLLGNAEPTVTVGVVSATGRNIVPSNDQPGLYLDMIQTDAAINPGNSGGPLTNALGDVVGVNSSIFTAGGGSIGLGFAIPIERAVRVAEELVRAGEVRRAWTGLETEGLRSMAEGRSRGGVLVTSVVPGGPAAQAGIRQGDVLTEANGRRLRNVLDWEAVKLDLRVGDPVTVAVRGSGGATVTRRLATRDLPTVTAEKVTVLRAMQLTTLTPAIRAERGVRSQAGALIYRISDEASAATGLQAGDVIVAINNVRVRDAEQVAELLDAMRRRQAFRLYFERGRQILFTDLAF